MTAQHQPDNDNLATIALIAIGGPLIALGGLVYVASWLASGQGPGIPFDDVMSGVIHLPTTMGDPAAAFPEPARSRLPGPHLYWGIHIAALVVVLAVGVKVALWSAGRGDGLDKRRRLDVDAQPRFATPREMRSERLPAPTPGRFPYARIGRHVIATHRHEIGRKTRTVPGALALVGPSRSGKSHSAIIGTQLWQGPAIISSVKTDLIAPTLDARQAQGEVRVYDPSRMTPMTVGQLVAAARRPQPRRRPTLGEATAVGGAARPHRPRHLLVAPRRDPPRRTHVARRQHPRPHHDRRRPLGARHGPTLRRRPRQGRRRSCGPSPPTKASTPTSSPTSRPPSPASGEPKAGSAPATTPAPATPSCPGPATRSAGSPRPPPSTSTGSPRATTPSTSPPRSWTRTSWPRPSAASSPTSSTR